MLFPGVAGFLGKGFLYVPVVLSGNGKRYGNRSRGMMGGRAGGGTGWHRSHEGNGRKGCWDGGCSHIYGYCLPGIVSYPTSGPGSCKPGSGHWRKHPDAPAVERQKYKFICTHQ